MSTTATSIAFIFLHFRSAEIKWLGCWKLIVNICTLLYTSVHDFKFECTQHLKGIPKWIWTKYMTDIFERIGQSPFETRTSIEDYISLIKYLLFQETEIWKTNHKLSIESSVCSVCLPILSLRTIPSGSVTLIIKLKNDSKSNYTTYQLLLEWHSSVFLKADLLFDIGHLNLIVKNIQ